MQCHAFVQDLAAELKNLRRKLHRIPENGFEERKTQAFILNYLTALGVDSIERIATTGVKAVFYAADATETIAFRADMDGLAMTELNECEYASSHAGRMHGCGHDGHMAVLLGLAKLISLHREQLFTNVVLLFQPAEESFGGARVMVAEGALDNPRVDRIYGLHVWPDVPMGRIGYREGPMMAQTCEFDVTITGKSAHGASPQDGIDAIVAASELIGVLQTVVSRTINPGARAVLTIGKISGGQARNIIAEKVELNGTIRSFSNGVSQAIQTRIGQIFRGEEISSGVDIAYKEVMHYPVVENPVPLCEHLAEIMEYDDIDVVDEIMAAEDFAFYQQYVPGMFFLLGVGGEKCRYPLHNTRFDFDESALALGLEIYRRLINIE